MITHIRYWYIRKKQIVECYALYDDTECKIRPVGDVVVVKDCD